MKNKAKVNNLLKKTKDRKENGNRGTSLNKFSFKNPAHPAHSNSTITTIMKIFFY
jgi:hypothetical protein